MSDEGERLARLERYGDMVQLLTPKQLVVVALRLEGMNGPEIAEELGITRKAVWLRLQGARCRLLSRYPELEREVAGRVMTGERSGGVARCGTGAE